MPDEVNYAEMTDEELMNVDDSSFSAVEPDPDDVPEVEVATEDTTTSEVDEDEEIKPQDESEVEDEPTTEAVVEEEEVEDEPAEETEVTAEDTDFRAETLAPLKANGKELKINSVDELRNLASMGANYSLKMQQIKPHMKMLKTLKKHDLLNEETINHLISLTKGDKGAISKLLKDSGIDPEYMDLPDASDYQADDHSIPDSELALDNVLDSIKHSEHYSSTMDIVGNVWDAQSRSTVAANPQSVKTIHDHVESGIYPKIWAEVERQRMLGNLTTQSDVEAYDTVGNAMQEQGMFNPTKQSGSSAKRNASRKAAGATRNLGTTKQKPKQLTEFDIMNMTDEEVDALQIPGLTM